MSSNLGWIRQFETATGAEITTDGWPIAPRERANDTNPERTYDPIIFSSPVIDSRGYVYIAAENQCVYGIDPEGEIKWQNCDFCSWASAGALLLDDGTLIVGADLPVVDGDECPAFVDGCDPPVYDKQGHLVALNTRTGEREWNVPIPNMHTFTCNEQIPNVLSDGTLIISGGTYGGLHAFTSPGAQLDRTAGAHRHVRMRPRALGAVSRVSSRCFRKWNPHVRISPKLTMPWALPNSPGMLVFFSDLYIHHGLSGLIGLALASI
mmetsp:Transcript_34570/g.80102  ORF Transcript_34570/g.80102 Transcript_34570/m.80102 type:complete len:265 (-) Transcript_34570:258-1052(-)